jgi:DNA-binding MarR family transcriptional regulator
METDFRPTGVVEVQTEYARRLKASRAEHYLYGPVRIADVRAASKLGGVRLALLVAIHFRRAVTRRETVTLPSGFLAEFGIDKSAKQRGLKRLEEAKLINVKRAAGHTAVIELRAKRKARTPSAPR